MSLFKIWKSEKSKEWKTWEDFRTWAINNRYKAEYGYKGEFKPDNLLKSMPGEKGEKDASKKTSSRSRNTKRI